MQYHKETDTYINEGVAFTIGETQYPSNWFNLTTPEEKLEHGFTEVTYSGVPEYSELHYTTEVREAGVISYVNTPKSDEQIVQIEKNKILTQIVQLEAEITPRRLREAMLGDTAWLTAKDTEISELRKKLASIK